MTKRLGTNPFVLLLMLTLLLLTACSSEGQTQVSEATAPVAEPQPTEAEPTETEPTEVPPTEIVSLPTETAASESGGSLAAPGIQMECTLVSDQPDTPAEFVAIFGVTEDDWVKGPETAAVTIVEYSDFQ